MGERSIKICVSQDMTEEMISDILSTAFEGGSNYWVKEVIVMDWPEGAVYASDVVAMGGSIVVSEGNDDEGQPVTHVLTLDKMVEGIRRACEYFNWTPFHLHENHDAGVADIVLQYALFGEEVYS